MNPFTFHIGVDTHLLLSLLFISYTGAMTKDARAQALVGKADAPHNYAKTGRRGSAADFVLDESIDGEAKM